MNQNDSQSISTYAKQITDALQRKANFATKIAELQNDLTNAQEGLAQADVDAEAARQQLNAIISK